MPTPPEGYWLANKRLPSVTTILSRFKDSAGLLHWAFREGQARPKASGLYAADGSAPKAAAIGTIAHKMVENTLHGMSAKDAIEHASMMAATPADFEKAKSAFKAYQSWAKNFRIHIVSTEIKLTSKKHRYGGTPDAVATVGDDTDLALLDWKTSNATYADHLAQLAAYRNLWDENFPKRRIKKGHHLLRFAKEHGDFHHHYYEKLDEAWKLFLLLREAYDLDKALKARAK